MDILPIPDDAAGTIPAATQHRLTELAAQLTADVTWAASTATDALKQIHTDQFHKGSENLGAAARIMTTAATSASVLAEVSRTISDIVAT
ncbi:hypothetical protein [Stackebrandtia nassauensis]|uniref:Uncharacterized protein n=1 Tax=Stackebrandtia nassauensis (strain DSM 44728 / CIP 108903 / NRRL B-16338 / NBRC 102104 / LLR-40K-21) TaxID=446470 RepID=D3PWP8_STANL|nr:hypothetical protein [Stackebrandtia nassauensis]ADD43270.1 hypothetical protein Snas_3610 [Stackebrandtia nassauensis DSM 44728]